MFLCGIASTPLIVAIFFASLEIVLGLNQQFGCIKCRSPIRGRSAENFASVEYRPLDEISMEQDEQGWEYNEEVQKKVMAPLASEETSPESNGDV